MDLARFVGIPYEHRGCDYRGADCYGLVKIFYRDVMNVELPDYQEMYGFDFNRDECADVIETVCGEWVETTDLSFGSVLTFCIMGAVCHVGLHIGSGDFLHAFNGTASCIESIRDLSWERRLHKVYEWQSIQKH